MKTNNKLNKTINNYELTYQTQQIYYKINKNIPKFKKNITLNLSFQNPKQLKIIYLTPIKYLQNFLYTSLYYKYINKQHHYKL